MCVATIPLTPEGLLRLRVTEEHWGRSQNKLQITAKSWEDWEPEPSAWEHLWPFCWWCFSHSQMLVETYSAFHMTLEITEWLNSGCHSIVCVCAVHSPWFLMHFIKIPAHYIFWVVWLNSLLFMTSASCKIFLVVYFQFECVHDSFTVLMNLFVLTFAKAQMSYVRSTRRHFLQLEYTDYELPQPKNSYPQKLWDKQWSKINQLFMRNGVQWIFS